MTSCTFKHSESDKVVVQGRYKIKQGWLLFKSHLSSTVIFGVTFESTNMEIISIAAGTISVIGIASDCIKAKQNLASFMSTSTTLEDLRLEMEHITRVLDQVNMVCWRGNSNPEMVWNQLTLRQLTPVEDGQKTAISRNSIFKEFLNQQCILQDQIERLKRNISISPITSLCQRQKQIEKITRFGRECAAQDPEKLYHIEGCLGNERTTIPQLSSAHKSSKENLSLPAKKSEDVTSLHSRCGQGHIQEVKWLSLNKGNPDKRNCSKTGQKVDSDERSPDWIDCSLPLEALEVFCLVVTKTGLPPLQWLFLHSLHLEPRSLMDQRICHAIPFLHGLLERLQVRSHVCLILVLTVSTMSVLALSIPMVMAHHPLRNRYSSQHRELWSLTMLFLAALYWGYERGSALEFFMIAMPLSISIGISLSFFHQSLLSAICAQPPKVQ